MKLYKSPTGEIWAYESDGSQDHLIPSNFVPLTQAEIDARNAEFARLQAEETAKEQAQAQAKASALAKLTALGLTPDEVKALIG
jgi:hypothetical protein